MTSDLGNAPVFFGRVPATALDSRNPDNIGKVIGESKSYFPGNYWAKVTFGWVQIFSPYDLGKIFLLLL